MFGKPRKNLNSFITQAREIAQKIIDAYGKDPAEYDELEQQALSALTFGAIYVPFWEKKKVSITEFQGVMVAVFIEKFHYDAGIVMSYFDFLMNCLEEEFHPTMNIIIHTGIDAYDFLDRPAELGAGLHKMVDLARSPYDPTEE